MASSIDRLSHRLAPWPRATSIPTRDVFSAQGAMAIEPFGLWLGQRERFDAPAITRAVVDGDTKRAKILLALGADPNAVDGNGARPLTWALALRGANEAELVSILLRAGADPLAQDAHGRCALHYAAMVDSASLGSLLGAAPQAAKLADNTGLSPLDLALCRGGPNAAKALASAGSDLAALIAMAPANGRRAFLAPLAVALARYGQADLPGERQAWAAAIDALLAAGANPEQRCWVERPPETSRGHRFEARPAWDYFFAALASLGDDARDAPAASLARTLLSAGWSARSTGTGGRDGLGHAAAMGVPSVALALLERGADPEATDDSGMSASALARGEAGPLIAAWRERRELASAVGGPCGAHLRAKARRL